jgi:hypothetical protein
MDFASMGGLAPPHARPPTTLAARASGSLRSLALVFLVTGCGERGRPVDPLDYIRVGADPSVEAAQVVRGLGEHGYRVVARDEADGFVALGFARAEPVAEAVRVVTRRGLVVVLDTPREEAPHLFGVRILPDAGDLDGDGRPEVAVAVDDRALDRTCISVVRVRDDGLALELPIERPPGDDDACIEALRDVGGDRRPEALLVVRFVTLARAAPPAVELAYRAVRAGGFERAPLAVYGDHARAEQARRDAALAEARRALDVDRAYALAVELAALARFRGEETSEQLRVFDAALAGLVLTPSQSRSVDDARRFIAAGWTGDGG